MTKIGSISVCRLRKANLRPPFVGGAGFKPVEHVGGGSSGGRRMSSRGLLSKEALPDWFGFPNMRIRHLPVMDVGLQVGMISICDLMKNAIEERQFHIEQTG